MIFDGFNMVFVTMSRSKSLCIINSENDLNQNSLADYDKQAIGLWHLGALRLQYPETSQTGDVLFAVEIVVGVADRLDSPIDTSTKGVDGLVSQ